jgi:hypothetical protein
VRVNGDVAGEVDGEELAAPELAPPEAPELDEPPPLEPPPDDCANAAMGRLRIAAASSERATRRRWVLDTVLASSVATSCRGQLNEESAVPGNRNGPAGTSQRSRC